MFFIASVFVSASVGKKHSMCPKNTMLIQPGLGASACISIVARSITPPPSKCITPSTFSVEKNRSAIIPTKKGEIIPAMGPTE